MRRKCDTPHNNNILRELICQIYIIFHDFCLIYKQKIEYTDIIRIHQEMNRFFTYGRVGALNTFGIIKKTLFFSTFLTLFVVISAADVLIVETQPSFSDTGFITSNGKVYLLVEVESLKTAGNLTHVSNNHCQYQDFHYLSPNGWVECQIQVPQSGNYNVLTRLVQHGNTGPKARLRLDGAEKGIIEGRGWKQLTFYMSSGTHTLRFEEAGSGSTAWPLRLVGIDSIAVTNNLSWEPPETLSTHPYTGNQYWWERPSADLPQVTVHIGTKSRTFSGQWDYSSLLLIDSANGSSQASIDYSQSGDNFAGEPFTGISVEPADSTRYRVVSNAGLLDRNRHAITPNYDMVNDEVIAEIPAGQNGYIQVQRYDGSVVRQLASGMEEWDGKVSDQPYADFAQKLTYLLRFHPVSGSTKDLYSTVYCDPLTLGHVKPRVLEFSPNGDDVYDKAIVNYQALSYRSDYSIVVKNDQNQTVRTLASSNPIEWDGKNNSAQLCSQGDYSIEISLGGDFKAGSRVRLLNRPATPSGPWQPTFFPLGMWTITGDGYSTASMNDIAAHNCNAIRVTATGTSGGTAAGFIDSADQYGLKVFVSLSSLAHNLCDMDIAPSEPQLESILAPYINPLKNKPALAGYYLLDEPPYVEEWGYRLRAIQQVIHSLDPAHPASNCLIGHDSRISDYSQQIKPKLQLIDVYPVSDNQVGGPGDFYHIWGYGWGTDPMEMLEYTDWAMSFVEPYGAGTWWILQGHRNDGQLEYPTPAEIRLQVWLGLTRAVKGFFFFAYEDQLPNWYGLRAASQAPLYNALSDLYGRLDPLIPVLLSLKKDDFNVSAQGGGILPAIPPNFPGYPNAEIAALQSEDGTKKYIVVANRNCTSSSNITIHSLTYGDRMLRDLETGTEYPMNSTILFEPGDGKIFEIILDGQQIPSTPTGLSVIEKTDSTISFDWVPSSDDGQVMGYHIYCNDIYLESSASPPFVHRCLDSQTNYTYRVSAYDDEQNESGLSLPLAVSTSYTGDLNGDMEVNLDDFFVFSQNWLLPDICDPGNFDRFASVDIKDFSYLVREIEAFEQLGTGLTGAYYDGLHFTSYVFTRVDPQVNFDWGQNSPGAPMGADTYCVRWTGKIYAPVSSANYFFYTHSDDGVRLWVNNNLIIDNWTDHAATEDSGRAFLSGGVLYDIQMEFYENGGDALAQLSWSYPGQEKTIIPQTHLYPN